MASTYALIRDRFEVADDQRVQRILKLARFLDDSIALPGTKYRIGWDTIIGLVPGIGDLATAGISTYLVWEAVQLGASNRVLARMLANVGIDAIVGAIPIAGDFFDAAYKCNKRNAVMLCEHLASQKNQNAPPQSHNQK